MTLKKDARNAKRRAAYAAKKKRTDAAQRGKNALNNVRKMDGFVSTVTGAGVSGVDKFTDYTFSQTNRLTDQTLECMFIENDIAATIVERVTQDALRGGYTVDWAKAKDDQAREAVEWAEAKYDVTSVMLKARMFSRLFGGGAVLVGYDGGDLGTERKEGSPVEFIRAVASRDLRAKAWFADPASQEFARVAIYDLQVPHFAPAKQGHERKFNNVEMDASRLLEMYGVLTTDERFREDGWGDSVLRRVYEVLRQFEASFQAVQHALAESSVPVYKVEGLLDLLASENADLLQARFLLLNQGKSNYRAIVLGENESYERVEAKMTEAAEVLQTSMSRVAAAAGMPSTVIFGRSPAGMNATGESDLEIWNQQVVKEQELQLAPIMRELYTALLADPDSPVRKVPEDLEIVFPSLWTPSLQDETNMYAQRAGADVGYVTAGVLKAEEVAVSRAAQGGMFPAIDTDGRDEALAMDVESVVAAAMEAGQGEAPEAAATTPQASLDPVTEAPEGLEVGAGAEPQKAALNGAQVTALQGIVTSVASGTLPKETAIELIITAFPVSREQATTILAAIEEPTEEEAAPLPAEPAAPGAPEFS